jgi:hypothetical protein
VHEDIRMINDASKEKDESHAGKVVERHWYDKNKHIFPASRWEVSRLQHAEPFLSLLPHASVRKLALAYAPGVPAACFAHLLGGPSDLLYVCVQVFDPKKDYGSYTIHGDAKK